MARIRSIKPEFNTSESVARLSESAQLFMLKLLTEVDDYGRILFLPKMIAGALYPHDPDVGVPEILRRVSELSREGIFVTYTIDGREYGCFPKWSEHQRVQKPGKSRIPPPPEDVIESASRGFREPSGDSPETLEESLGADLGSRSMDLGIERERAREPYDDVNDAPRETYDGGELVLTMVEDDPEAKTPEDFFEEFWEAYPESANMGKKSAENAFNHLHFSNVDLEEVVAGAKRYAKAVEEHGWTPRYVMAPSTFLRLSERRWENTWKTPENTAMKRRLDEANAAAARFTSSE